ncbi:MAG: cyclic nucleotide-binding domain-containing protein [Pseudomonadales bacterium]
MMEQARLERRPAAGQNGFFRVSVPENAVLFEAGAPADALYLVEEGRMAMVDGQTGAVVGTAGAGEAFGEQAILRGGVRSADARGHLPSTLLEIPAAALRDTLEKQSASLQALFHAAMLELLLWNRARQGRISEAGPFQVPVDRLMLGRSRGELQHTLTSAAHQLAVPEFLLLKLVLNPKLDTLALSEEKDLRQVLFSFGHALVLTHGTVTFHCGGMTFYGGPGTVLGLGGSLCRLPEFSVRPLSTINALVLPMERLVGDLVGLNAGLLAVLRSIVLRTLGRTEAPPSMVAVLSPRRHRGA